MNFPEQHMMRRVLFWLQGFRSLDSKRRDIFWVDPAQRLVGDARASHPSLLNSLLCRRFWLWIPGVKISA